MPAVTLNDRAFFNIGGTEAQSFLQGLLTTDIARLPQGEAWPGALLTPQGKILFEFLIHSRENDYQLEMAASQADAFLKRLLLYRLRAKVTIERDADNCVTVFWDGPHPKGAVLDHRFALAGILLYRLPGEHGRDALSLYHELRIDHAIAEAGLDFPLSDAFPHDALYDVNGGVSFTKGCYIGQEVVSRMRHRATARRRVVMIHAKSPLPDPGTPLRVDGKEIGTLGSVCGVRGLAIARIDRIAEGMAKGSAIMAGDICVNAQLPEWSGLSWPDTQVSPSP